MSLTFDPARNQCYVVKESVQSSEEARKAVAEVSSQQELVIFVQSADHEFRYQIYCVDAFVLQEYVIQARTDQRCLIVLRMFGFPLTVHAPDLLHLWEELQYPRMVVKHPFVFVFSGFMRDPDHPATILPYYDIRILEYVRAGTQRIDQMVTDVESFGGWTTSNDELCAQRIAQFRRRPMTPMEDEQVLRILESPVQFGVSPVPLEPESASPAPVASESAQWAQWRQMLHPPQPVPPRRAGASQEE